VGEAKKTSKQYIQHQNRQINQGHIMPRSPHRANLLIMSADLH